MGSLFFLIREVYYGWCLRYFHSSGASFVFLFLFLHLGRAIFYGSYFYNPNTWFSGILILFFLMAIAFMGYFILTLLLLTVSTDLGFLSVVKVLFICTMSLFISSISLFMPRTSTFTSSIVLDSYLAFIL